jgi:hypothetical protein
MPAAHRPNIAIRPVPRTSLEKWLALATAMTSLPAAGLGFFATQNNQLAAENTSLRAQPPSAPSSGGPSSSTPIKCTLVDPRGGTTGYYQAAFGDATITK